MCFKHVADLTLSVSRERQGRGAVCNFERITAKASEVEGEADGFEVTVDQHGKTDRVHCSIMRKLIGPEKVFTIDVAEYEVIFRKKNFCRFLTDLAIDL